MQKKLEARLATEFPNLIARVYPLELGPPVGWPVQYRVTGPDIAEVRGIAMKLAQVVAGNPHTTRSISTGSSPRANCAAGRSGRGPPPRLSSASLAAIVNTVVSALVVTQLRDDIYLATSSVRAQGADRISLDTLRTMQVGAAGRSFRAALQFVTFSYDLDAPLIWRRDRVPTLTVAADIKPACSPRRSSARWRPASRRSERSCRLPTTSPPAARSRRREVAGFVIAVGDR